MKISTEIHSASNIIGEEKAIELIAAAGFDAWDFSMFEMAKYDWDNNCLFKSNHPLSGKDYLRFARKLKQIGLDNGIHCNQSHAPFPIYIKDILDFQKRAIECTAEAGGKICVIHPDNFKSAGENAEIFFELLPFAKNCGVKIATENMWGWDSDIQRIIPHACGTPCDFVKHIDLINDEFFVACLDLGHAEIVGEEVSAVNMIKALGNRLKALHVHDTDLIHDSHQIPFSMDMDFDAIAKALKEINYTGYITLEADRYLSAYDRSNVFEGIKKLADAAGKIAGMVE